MAQLVGNNVYLTRDGVDVSAFWTEELSYSEESEDIDTTAGSNNDYRTFASGVSSCTISLMLVHDTTDWNTHKAKFKVGSDFETIYGLNGNTTGQSKFQGKMRIRSMSHVRNVAKNRVAHRVEMTSSAEPTATVYQGDVF